MYWFGAKRFLTEFQCQDPHFVSISCTNFATRRWTAATQHQTNTSVQKCRFKWCSKTTWPSPRSFLTSSSCSSTRWSPNCKCTDTFQTPTFPYLDPETLLFGYRRISLKLRIVVASVVMVLLFGVSMALTRISTDDCVSVNKNGKMSDLICACASLPFVFLSEQRVSSLHQRSTEQLRARRQPAH